MHTAFAAAPDLLHWRCTPWRAPHQSARPAAQAQTGRAPGNGQRNYES